MRTARFFNDRAGSMALFAAGLLVAVTLIAGGVVDVISLSLQKHEVQQAADAAALGAARELQVASKDDERLIAVATSIAVGNLNAFKKVEVTAGLQAVAGSKWS